MGPTPHPDALFNLGKLFFSGIPGEVEADVPKALEMFDKASKMDDR
jgi:TPR repeat protein